MAESSYFLVAHDAMRHLVAFLFLSMTGACSPSASRQPAPSSNAKAVEARSGTHLFLAYAGARDAPRNVTRTKDEARKLADEIVASARRTPGSFPEIVERHSDEGASFRSGPLGVWHRGQMVPLFDEVFDRLKVGEISAPVESPYGFHVLMRTEIPAPEPLAAAQILVAWQGSTGAAPTVTRSREEARALIDELKARLRATPGEFEELARKHSDGPSAGRGGPLPPWTRGQPTTIPMVLTLAVERLALGQVSDVVETSHGFNLLRRVVVPPRLSAAHILVSYKGAHRAPEEITRSKEQAASLVATLSGQLQRNPKLFEKMALERSDCPSRKDGGRLGTWYKGWMEAEFEETVERLKIGEIGGPVETRLGFHLVQRLHPAL